MAKKLLCLVLSLMFVAVLTTSAWALDTLNLLSVRVYGQGYLSVIAGTDYTAEADMNFSAYTENGELLISDSVVLRNEGTSWFVILEYGNYSGNESHQKTADRVLKKVAEMIDDKDDGALVRCDEDHTVTLEKADALRNSLRATPQATDAKELANSVRGVMSYIRDNGDKLMPNVAVIIITACPSSKVTDYMIDDIGNTLNTYNGVTTHIIVTAAASVYKEDRVIGQKLIDKAKLTVGGTGYMTEKLTESEADKAVQRINDSERRKILMLLYPQDKSAIGHKLTITQTTAGGKELKAEVDLPDSLYDLWLESYPEDNPPAPPKPDDVTRSTTLYSGSGWIATDYNPPVAQSGMSTDLLVGIIAGAVVLILLAILLIIWLRKGKKPKQSASKIYGTNSSAQQAPAGTTLTLAGADGTSLKGQMKNGMLTVGRNGAKAMVSVPNDGKLSGLHATFTKQGNMMMITDNGSTNGTKVNGNKIAAGVPTAIQQNDTVSLGSTTYTVTWRG